MRKFLIFSFVCIFSFFATLSFAMEGQEGTTKVPDIEEAAPEFIPLSSDEALFEEWEKIIRVLPIHVLAAFGCELGLNQNGVSEKLKEEFGGAAENFRKNMYSYFDKKNVFNEIAGENKLNIGLDLVGALETAFPYEQWSKSGSLFYLYLKKLCLFFTNIKQLDFSLGELIFIPDFALEMKNLEEIKILFSKTVDKNLINKFVVELRKNKVNKIVIKEVCEERIKKSEEVVTQEKDQKDQKSLWEKIKNCCCWRRNK